MLNIYHKKFLNSFASENVIGLFSIYKNAHKEITESWSMLEAATKHIQNLNEYLTIVVGDGATPRTGALLAYYTKTTVISIDPNFNLNHWENHKEKQTKMGFPPQRIKLIKNKIENISIYCEEKPCLILWPHSHADMNKLNITNYKTRSDIALPCCVPIPTNWIKIPHITYKDPNILSPKNEIHIWLPHQQPS